MTTNKQFDKTEIIIFGKGYGESILIRVSESKYIMIDSFIDNESGKPIAVWYLETIGLNVDSIIGIVCTHWDDDHVKGISQIIKSSSKPVPIYTPLALSKKEVIDYLTYLKNEDKGSEFIEAIRYVKDKKCYFLYVVNDRSMFEKELSLVGVSLKALSPSDEQYQTFLENIIIPKAGEEKKFKQFGRNELSIVSYLECPNSISLFAGDFENSSTNDWTKLIDKYNYLKKCEIVKTPHHGSENGYHDGIYNSLSLLPISIITRFNRFDLPSDEILKKISSKSKETFVIGGKKITDKDQTRNLTKYLNSGIKKRMSINDLRVGFIKLTKDISSQTWDIEKYGSVEKYLDQTN